MTANPTRTVADPLRSIRASRRRSLTDHPRRHPRRVTTAGGTTQSSGSFTVQPLEEIALHPAPDAVTLPSGGHGYTVVSLENLGLIEYAQVLRLTVEGLPAGVQYRIDDNGLTLHRPATLVFFGTDGLAPGSYTVTVVAEGLIDGVLTRRTVEITLDVLAPGSTTLAGRVLHAEDDRPLAGIRIQLGDAVTHTDAAGHYLFRDPPSGEQVVLIDAGILNTPEVHYPSRIPMPAHVIPNRANSVLTSYIAPVDATRYTAIDPGQAVSVTDDQLPGYALNIPQGAVLTGWDGQPIDKVNVRRVPIDRLPIRPLPEGTAPKSVYLYYFFRPGGAEPSEPIPVTMINDLGLLPGEKADLWYYDESPEADPESNQWRIMGQGTVSADGQSIVSDPGVGIPKFCCGASFPTPPTPGGPPPTCNVTSGNPVDLATGVGSVLEKHTIGVPGILPVRMECGYSSNSTHEGPFGLGTWTHHDWRLLRAGDTMTAVTPQGLRYTLVRGANGEYRAQSGRPGGYGLVGTVSGSGLAILRFGDGRRYEFSTSGPLNSLLLAEQDAHGNRITYQRDIIAGSIAANGRVRSITDGNGRVYRLDYTADYIGGYRIASVTDPLGRTQRYAYDSAGRLTQVTDIAGNITRYAWNDANRIIQKTDASGAVTRYAYDAAGRTVEEILPDGGIFRFAYQLAGQTVTETEVTDPNGNVTVHRFTGLGYESRRTDAQGRRSERSYDLRNLLRSTTDPLGRRYFYTYDDRGNRTSVRDPEGNISLYAYDPLYNQVTTYTDPTGRSIHHSYTAQGRLRQSTNSNGDSRYLTWTQSGKLESATDSLGGTIKFTYDENDYLVVAEDQLGRRNRFEYDEYGHIVKSIDALGRTTRYHYNLIDKIVKIESASGGITSIKYDENGRLIGIVNANGNVINSRVYDDIGRVIEVNRGGGVNSGYEYDNNGNIIRRHNSSGLVSSNYFDELNRLVRVEDYDGRVTELSYDIADRLSQVNDSESGITKYGYDSLDRLTSELSNRGMIEYVYDAAGRIKQRRINKTYVTQYDYDESGRIVRIYVNGKAVTYVYDSAGRIAEIKLPNGIMQSYIYDAAGQITSIQYIDHNNTVIDQISYRYDLAGQIISRLRRNAPSYPETPFVATYDADNRMLTYNGKPLTYDKNGNLIRRETDAGPVMYSWDARSRLTRIVGPYGVATFKYDHAGRRVEKTVNGHTVGYLYDGLQAVAELQGSALGSVYHTGLAIDEVLARYTPAKNRYLITDALGSIIAEADDQGDLKTTYIYSPYGELNRIGESSDNPLQYTGRENDDMGIYYYRSRYYDPQIKRFISADPIGLAGGINSYSYVMGKPVSMVDPLGLYIPTPTANCWLNILTDVTRFTGTEHYNLMPEKTYTIWFPLAMNTPWGRAPDIMAWLILTYHSQDFDILGLYERAIAYEYVCKTKDDCGNETLNSTFGMSTKRWWEIMDSGTLRWITTEVKAEEPYPIPDPDVGGGPPPIPVPIPIPI